MAKRIQSIEDLVSDDHNARRHTPRNIGMIEESLRRYGANRGIVVDESGKVWAGNGVLEAAINAGFEKVQVIDVEGDAIPVIRVKHLTEQQLQEYAIADNRTAELAEWDTEILARLEDSGEIDLSTFWLPEEFDSLFEEAGREGGFGGSDGDLLVEGLGDPDEVPEEDEVEYLSKPGQIWQIGDHRLMCGDATSPEDVAALFGNERADMVWTDPPYGVAIGDKNKWLNTVGKSNRIEQNLKNDTLTDAGLRDMLDSAFGLAADYCTPGASWYVAAPAGPLHLIWGELLNERGIWRQTIQWVKHNATFSPMGVSYHWKAEPIFYGWLPNAAHRYYGDRKQTTVWEIDRPLKSEHHPTMKPVELVERAIRHASQPGEIVYDAFTGSGTTGIAAHRAGRRAFMMELDPRYCDVTRKRLEDFTGESATLVEEVAAVAS